MRRIIATIAAGLIAVVTATPGRAQQDLSPDDPVFQRWPELRRAYFETAQTKVATHKFVAMPMPRQCAFLYVDVYSSGGQSEREIRDKAVRDCSARLGEMGPLNENYSVACTCRPVIGKDKYRLDFAELPAQVYAPFSMFYKDRQGQMARLNGYAEIGLAPRGSGAQVPFRVFNRGGQVVCTGTMNAVASMEGRYSLNCLRGAVVSNGTLVSGARGLPSHSVARGATAQGQPIVLVVGLPAQMAYDTHGRL
jgi:hypothetical protein